MASEHIVKSYDQELKHLQRLIARMGGLAEQQLAQAIEAVEERDSALAARIIAADRQVDDLEAEVDAHVVNLLARRQPMAVDLREIVAALKIGTFLERIADYAKNVAKRTIELAQAPAVQPAYSVPRLGRYALGMLKDVLDAYNGKDAEKAREVWSRDGELDDLYNSLFRELLTYMMEDPRSIGVCTHLLFIAKNLERIGDHATNVAENVHFQVTGRTIGGERPRGAGAEAAKA
jgi:phosphate transport system protein